MTGWSSSSTLRHIGLSHWLKHDPKRCLVGLFTTHYDTSVSGENAAGRAVVTAGMMTSETQMRKFSDVWDKALLRANVPFVHMKELPNYFKNRDAERQQLLNRAVEILRKRVDRCSVVLVALDDYAKIDRDFALSEQVGSAEGLCVGSSVYQAHKWAEEHRPNQPVAHYHEAGDAFLGEGKIFAKKQGIILNELPTVNAAGVCFAPFQAMDFLAWEVRRGFEQYRGKSEYDFREQIHRIATQLKMEIHVWNGVEMQAKCERDGILRR